MPMSNHLMLPRLERMMLPHLEWILAARLKWIPARLERMPLSTYLMLRLIRGM